VFAGSLSGVLADRWDRRYVMIISDAGQAVGTLLLLASFLSGRFELWHLYAVTLIQSVFGVFQYPAFQASVTMLVPEGQRERANAIQQMTGPMAGIIAPAIAGVIYAAVGVSGAIAVDLATFLAAGAIIVFIRIPRPAETEEGAQHRKSVAADMLTGLRFLYSKRMLFWVTMQIALVNFLLGGTFVLATPYLLARTGDEATLGVLIAIFNSGAIVGGIIIGIWGGIRPRIHMIMGGIIAAGIGLMLVGMGQVPVALGIALFVMMLPLPMINASATSLMQLKIPPDLQGRVFAVIGQLSTILTPLSYLIIGPLADNVFEPGVNHPAWASVAPLVGDGVGAGMGLLMVIGGGLTALTTLMVYALPAVRHLEANMPDYTAVAAPPSGTLEASAADLPAGA
jgi:MFS family permease